MLMRYWYKFKQFKLFNYYSNMTHYTKINRIKIAFLWDARKFVLKLIRQTSNRLVTNETMLHLSPNAFRRQLNNDAPARC